MIIGFTGLAVDLGSIVYAQKRLQTGTDAAAMAATFDFDRSSAIEETEAMPPYQGGGDMISSVTFEKTLYNVIPYKFEAGTPNIADVIGLGAGIDYVNRVGLENIGAHEHDLLVYATERLSKIPGLRIIGTARDKASVISFVLEHVHPHDVGTVLDQEGIAVRTGHHCAQPVMDRFGISGTSRPRI